MKRENGRSSCGVNRSLEVIGDSWSLLIIRDASFGVSRFDDFQRSLGVARNMLSLRLKQLTEAGILAKQEDERGRSEYRLTDKGWDLMPVLLAMTHWGDKHMPGNEGERVVFVDRETGRPIEPMSVHDADGSRIGIRDIRAKLPNTG